MTNDDAITPPAPRVPDPLVVPFARMHYGRGGSTPDMLAEIPGDRIHCVQLNDGPLRQVSPRCPPRATPPAAPPRSPPCPPSPGAPCSPPPASPARS